MNMLNVLSRDRIVLHYPPILAEDKARFFLDAENKALELVEEVLQAQYQGQVTIYIKISPFREHYVKTDGIYHCLPALDLRGISGEKTTVAVGRLHELAHFIAQELLCPIKSSEPPGFFIVEGLAMAVNATTNPEEAVHLHLVAKGLVLLGALKPVLQIVPSDPPFLRYEVAGSFTHFLMKQYGVEKLTELYTFINESDFDKAAVRIYGRPIPILEEKWKGFLAHYLPNREEAARYAALASLDLNQLRELPIVRNGNQWFRQGIIEDLPEGLYAQDLAVYEALSALTRKESSSKLEHEYEFFRSLLEVYCSSLRKWQEAAMAFREARQLLIDRHTNYDVTLTALRQAYTYLQELNDTTMMSRTRLYAALILSKKAHEEINGNRDKARRFLQAAETFLSSDPRVPWGCCRSQSHDRLG
jgi:hypothetical protein